MKITDSKTFNKLREYYYDNIHWADNDYVPSNTFGNWLASEYGAVYSFFDQSILFKDEKKFTYFSLVWL